jgi:hypothetical protein
MGKHVLNGTLAFRKRFLSGKLLLSVPCGSVVDRFHCIMSSVRTTRPVHLYAVFKHVDI